MHLLNKWALALSLAFLPAPLPLFAQTYPSPVMQGFTVRSLTGPLVGNGTSPATATTYASPSQTANGTSTTNPVNPSGLIGSAAIQTVTEASNAATVNWQSGYNAIITLNANLTTLTLSNPSDGMCYNLRLVQGAGPYAVTWPASVDWGTPGAPTLSATNGLIDMVALCYYGAASKYHATIAQGF